MAALTHLDADDERLCSVAARVADVNLSALWKCPLGEPKTDHAGDVSCPRCLPLMTLMAQTERQSDTEKTRAALMRIPVHQIRRILTGDSHVLLESGP